mmetsp:Transcript_16733/g.33980  ORF Transcript_16733/g.33980 Transcript_16733/m.33980 type:complete len:96 (+) Transcript_16733:429-716(+)
MTRGRCVAAGNLHVCKALMVNICHPIFDACSGCVSVGRRQYVSLCLFSRVKAHSVNKAAPEKRGRQKDRREKVRRMISAWGERERKKERKKETGA